MVLPALRRARTHTLLRSCQQSPRTGESMRSANAALSQASYLARVPLVAAPAWLGSWTLALVDLSSLFVGFPPPSRCYMRQKRG